MGTRMDVRKGWAQEMLLLLVGALPTLPDERYYYRQNFHAETEHVKYLANYPCGTGPSCASYTYSPGQKLTALWYRTDKQNCIKVWTWLSWLNFGFYSRICLDGRREITKNFTHNSRSMDRVLNTGSSEYEGVLLI
jgi:hypothetical protein